MSFSKLACCCFWSPAALERGGPVLPRIIWEQPSPLGLWLPRSMTCWKAVGMEVQDYKKPNVQLDWKVPVCQFRLLYVVSCTSQSNPLVLVPPWPFRVAPLGAGWVQSTPSGAWSACVARRDGLSSAFSRRRQRFRSMQWGNNRSDVVQRCFQGPPVKFNHPWSCLE